MREVLSVSYKPIKRFNIINEGNQIMCINGKFHTDNRTEYKTEAFKNLLQREGIIYDPCLPQTPQHNAVAERLNLEIEVKTTANLASAGMPTSFWGMSLTIQCTFITEQQTNL